MTFKLTFCSHLINVYVYCLIFAFRPMSYMWVGNSLTDVGGNFDNAGAASFRGKFVRLVDSCGFASLGLNGGNSINWGTSRGTDCELMHHIVSYLMPLNVLFC